MFRNPFFPPVQNVIRRSSLWGTILFLLSVFLTACAAPPTPTPVGGDTEALNSSGTPTGEGEKIFLPLFQNKEAQVPLPSAAPLAEWTVAGHAVPVMPGAQAGQEMDGRYVFTTPASLVDIETYYFQEMPKRGWVILSIGESMEVKDWLFQLGEVRLTIHAEFLPEQNLSYVVIGG